MPHPEMAPVEAQDWRPVLDRELSRLPEKYRAPIVLCDLEGRPRREAARRLGLPEGTLASRLATARQMLARRLTRSGVSLSGGALAVAMAEGASASVPAPLVVMTARAAALVAAGKAAAVTLPAAALTKEVLQAMGLTKLKFAVSGVLVAAMLGVGGLAYRASGQTPTAPERPAKTRPATDLDVLRQELELLKLRVEMLQEKVRAQEAELRALKGRRGPGGDAPTPRPGSGTTPVGEFPDNTPAHRGGGNKTPPGRLPPNTRPPATAPAPDVVDDPDPLPPQTAPGAVPDHLPAPVGVAPPPAVTARPPAQDLVKEVEAALKLLKQAKNEEAKQQLADTLKKLRDLQQRDSGRPGGQ